MNQGCWIYTPKLQPPGPADMQPNADSSPIQSLCPNVLTEIFAFCFPQADVSEDSWHVESISTRKAPLLLCSVCSSWRSLAISTPHLWQALHIDADNMSLFWSDEFDTKSITSGIHTWLDRSGVLPLDIRVRFGGNDLFTARGGLILEILSQEISRWEHFELIEGFYGFWITSPHFGTLPMLHTFKILQTSIDGIPFTAAPRLKRLQLRSLPNLTSVSAIPLDQLVDLVIEKAQTISTVVEIIQRCHRLESLALRVDESDKDGSLTPGSIIQHDTLRRLQLHIRPYINMVTDHLTLPALTDLSLMELTSSIFDVEASFFYSKFIDFFTRSNCELQQFELHCYRFGPSELLECLSHRSFQTLTRLLIQQDHESLSPERIVGRELLVRLTFPDVDDDVPLCPKLAHLTLFYCYSVNRSFELDGLLGRMVQSRCFGRAQDARLRSLELSHFDSLSEEDRELLEIAQSNGGLEVKA